MYAACQYIQKLGKPLSAGCAWNRICAGLCSVLGAPAGQEQPRIADLSPWALSPEWATNWPCFRQGASGDLGVVSACFLTHACVHAVAQLCPTLCDPWTVAHQVPLYMGFSRQEYWSGLPFSPPRDLPDPGIEPGSLALQAASFSPELPGKLLTWMLDECFPATLSVAMMFYNLPIK